MATQEVSIDISISNVSVSGSTYNGNISWNAPEIPSGASIISCTLSGTLSYKKSKGKDLSFSVNGTSVGTSGSFNISLGTNISTTSVNVTGSGGNGSSAGTLSYSNVKYTVIYEVESSSPPVITILSQDVSRISDVTGHDICTVTFTADQALKYWEARATTGGTTGHGIGLLVESGVLAEGAIGTIRVENEELTNGDLTYTISIFGQNGGGVWSDE